MMKRIWISAATLALGANLACGKKLSDAQQADVSNLVGGVSNSYQKTPGVSVRPATGDASAPDTAPTFLAFMGEEMRGAIWLMKFKAEGELAPYAPGGGRDGFTISSCPTSTFTSGGTSCTFSCPVTTSLKLSCTSGTTSTSTCNSVAYSLASPSFSLTYDFSKVTGDKLSAATGTFGLSLTFGGNVSGGNLDGKALACTIGLSFDVAKAQAGTAQVPALTCDNFTCTYDAKDLDCTKVQSSIGSKSCT
jgi:hypothetical protein